MNAPARNFRVLMTTDAIGGLWTFATELAQQLTQTGCQVDLVVLGPQPMPAQRDAMRAYPGINIEVTDLALEWQDPAGRDFARSCEVLGALARRRRPDIVHVNGFREALADWDAPVLITAHSCVWSWWRSCRGGDPDTPEWRAYIENVGAALAKGQWVAPTKAFAAEIEALYWPPTRGLVIHNGIARSGRSQPKEEFILAAGRFWDEAKNVAALAEAAPNVRWPICVAGPVRGFDAHASAAAGSCGRGLTFLGGLSREEVREHMERAGVFVSPARYEPFGLAILEAASADCALVLADIPSLRELWDGAALFVDPRDAGDVAGALDRVCQDATLRRKLAEAARRRARRYSVEATARSYFELYQALLAPRAGALPDRAPMVPA